MIELHHRMNLIKLRDYLAQLPDDYDRFSMAYFQKQGGKIIFKVQEAVNECATVACAAGHGPMAGVPIHPDDRDWMNYIVRVFCYGNGDYEWLFSEDWSYYRPTHQDAVQRINAYLYNDGRPAILTADFMDIVELEGEFSELEERLDDLYEDRVERYYKLQDDIPKAVAKLQRDYQQFIDSCEWVIE